MATLRQTVETGRILTSHVPPHNNVINDPDYQHDPFLCPNLVHTDIDEQLQPTGCSLDDTVQDKWGLLARHCKESDSVPPGTLETIGLQNFNTSLTFGRQGNHRWLPDLPGVSWNAKLTHLLTCNDRMSSAPMSPFVHGYNSDNISLMETMTDNFSDVMANMETSPMNSNLKHGCYDVGKYGCDSGLVTDSINGELAIQKANPYAGQATISILPSETITFPNAAEFSSFNNFTLLQSAVLPRTAQYSGVDVEFTKEPSTTQSSVLIVPIGLDSSPCSMPNSPNGLKGLKCNVLKDSRSDFNPIICKNVDCHATSDNDKSMAEESTKLVSRKRSSSLPTLVEIDGSEGSGRLCDSLGESDGSLGLEVSSGCDQENGRDPFLDQKLPFKKKKPKGRFKINAVQLSEVKDHERTKVKEKRHKWGDDSNEDVSSRIMESNDSDDSMHRPRNDTSKPIETPKPDYIHVRARRGQATDSHSLAERIRREKISERMKYLQDLVPGCSKITGKAVMLDEIINYVQSLQRQVEFLSMKLAVGNTRVDFTMDSLLRKEVVHSQIPLRQPTMFAPAKLPTFGQFNWESSHPPRRIKDHGSIAKSLLDVCFLQRSDPELLGASSTSAPLISKEAFISNPSQETQKWYNELQNLVQTSYAQGRQTCLTSVTVQGEEAFTCAPLKPDA